MMDTDPTLPQITITNEAVDGDTVAMPAYQDADTVDAEVVEDEPRTPSLRWMPEVWRLVESEEFADISASVIQTRPGGGCYVYLYRTAAPPEIVWRGRKFPTLEAAELAVEDWLYGRARQAADGEVNRPSDPPERRLGPCQE